MAVDDAMGMTFNNRRQSQDGILRRHLLEESKSSRLWINHYTAGQFEVPLADHILVDDEFLDKAAGGDFCFVENLSVAKYEQNVKKIILFKWNRAYPADTYFDIPLSKNGWKLTFVFEFAGNSHEKITKEIWENEKEDI